MNVKPILFNTEMVRAILKERKTVTRRVAKPQPVEITTPNGVTYLHWKEMDFFNNSLPKYGPYRPGQTLYVRETFAHISDWVDVDPEVGLFDGYIYRADWTDGEDHPNWRPSIHMPREAARIFLRVTDVRVERLQDITPEQAIKEGVIDPANRPYIQYEQVGQLERYVKSKVFSEVWNSTIKPADSAIYGWDANPWAWVIEFERCEKPKEV